MRFAIPFLSSGRRPASRVWRLPCPVETASRRPGTPLRSAPAAKRGSAPLGRLCRLAGSVRRWKRLWALSYEKGAGGRQNRNVGTRPLRRAHIRRSGGADRGDSCRCFLAFDPVGGEGKAAIRRGDAKAGYRGRSKTGGRRPFFRNAPLPSRRDARLPLGKKPEPILQTDCCRAPRRSRPAP